LPPVEIERSIDFMMRPVKENIQITVDHRERSAGLVAELHLNAGAILARSFLLAPKLRRNKHTSQTDIVNP